MSTALLVPLADYLRQTTDPDCDYLEGRLVERNLGEISHGDAQGRTYAYVLTTQPGFWAGVEIRVQVKPNRFRVPDVVVMRGGRPAGRVITVPPEVAVEVLAPDDRAADLQEKVDDYLAFGVPTVWVIDPERQRAWMHTLQGSHEVRDGLLRNAAGDLAVPLTAVFPGQSRPSVPGSRGVLPAGPEGSLNSGQVASSSLGGGVVHAVPLLDAATDQGQQRPNT